VEAAASAEMKTTGEWLRDLALSAIDEKSGTASSAVALPEIIGVRLLLVNVLRTLATGQKLIPEAFDKLLDEIGTAKYELAEKLASERRR
jgi:hypothetical protein